MITALLHSPLTTGAITKYTKSSIQDMLENINRTITKKVVEFGPGWGNITQTILDKLSPDGQLICFEINKQDFQSHLDKIQDSRLTIHYCSCEYIDEYSKESSLDLIISTIPFSLIENTIIKNIITRSYTALKPGGQFITGQYSSYAKKFLTPQFQTINKRRNLRNLPPVCILTATK